MLTDEQVSELKEGQLLVSTTELHSAIPKGKIVTFDRLTNMSNGGWLQVKELLQFPMYSEHSCYVRSFDLYDPEKYPGASIYTADEIRARYAERVRMVGGAADVGLPETI